MDKKSQFREFVESLKKEQKEDLTSFKGNFNGIDVLVQYDVCRSMSYGTIHEDCIIFVYINNVQILAFGATDFKTQFPELRAIYENCFLDKK